MSTGWIALAAAALLAGAPQQGADDVVCINQRKFTIPIKVKPERRHEVKELLLYVSRDSGKTWGLFGRVAPDKSGFDFYGDSDGTYFFQIAVIDRSGMQEPRDADRAPVGQKILIDTQKPVLKITTAERVPGSDDVLLAYTMQEDRPDMESLKLEYKAGEGPGGQWTPLPVQFAERGNFKFNPRVPGPVTVRLSLRDQAGNEAVEEKTVPAAGMRMDGAIVRATDVVNNNSITPPPPSPPAPTPTPTPDLGPRTNTPLATTTQPTPPQPPINDVPMPNNNASMPTRGSLPPLQIVNKQQSKLGFDVTRFGPSGLGSVDVYVTTDEGATWEKSQADPNVTLPVTPEVRGTQPVTGSVTVNLPKNGVIYGFYLVVKSRAGLGKEPPRAGDPPQVRIELDTAQPEAELYGPTPDPSHPNCLVLTWKATDRNLAPNPVTLEWAAKPDGPWLPIGEMQLANTGRYLWHVQDNTPPKVYLKLSVRDTAGNTAVAQLPQPVLIDMQPPEVNNVKLMTGR